MSPKYAPLDELKKEQAQTLIEKSEDDGIVSDVLAGKSHEQINQWLEIQKRKAIKEARAAGVHVNESRVGKIYEGNTTIAHARDHSIEIGFGEELTVKQFRSMIWHEIDHTQQKKLKLQNPDGETITTQKEMKQATKLEDLADMSVGRVYGPEIGISTIEKLAEAGDLDPYPPHRAKRKREANISTAALKRIETTTFKFTSGNSARIQKA